MTDEPNVTGEAGVAGETGQLPTYKVGDKIRIEVEARDESGVAGLEANFTHDSDTSRHLIFDSEGHGQTEAFIVLEKEVTNDIAPGDHSLFYLSLEDILGNREVISGPYGMRFRIETVPQTDYEPPELKNWRMLRPYTVQAGDTLVSIAETFNTTVDAIIEANDIEDPDLNLENQMMYVPIGPDVQIYTAQPGDTLEVIAQRFYNDASQWRRILEANRNQISDPNLMFPVQRLQIPKSET